MSKYNLEKLIKVKIVEPKISNWYRYKKKIPILRKNGIYDRMHNFYGQDVEFHYVENGVVYEYAKCILLFENDVEITYHYKLASGAKVMARDVERIFYNQFKRDLIEL